MKVALIFDNQLRPETTGLYCRRALGALCDVEHLLPEELDRIPSGLFDLYLMVDDGLDYAIPDQLRPSAAWAIDTHMSLDRALARFGSADWVFAAQKIGAQKMCRKLGRDVQWLPLACDPELHHPIAGESPKYDVGFVGHVISDRRQAMLAIVRQEFASHWIGQAFFEQMARLYSQFRVAFNCGVAADVNMRVFEALACGSALVTDAVDGNGLSDLLDEERHLLCYRDAESSYGKSRD